MKKARLLDISLVGDFNPSEILVKMGLFPISGVNIENIWSHHLALIFNSKYAVEGLTNRWHTQDERLRLQHSMLNVGIISQWHMPSVCSILSPLPFFVDYIVAERAMLWLGILTCCARLHVLCANKMLPKKSLFMIFHFPSMTLCGPLCYSLCFCVHAHADQNLFHLVQVNVY